MNHEALADTAKLVGVTVGLLTAVAVTGLPEPTSKMASVVGPSHLAGFLLAIILYTFGLVVETRHYRDRGRDRE